MRDVTLAHLPLGRLTKPLDREDKTDALTALAEEANEKLGDRAVWNISATETGGGVAEMLKVLVGYALGVGIDARWAVIEGEGDFFPITKRIHNGLHGSEGDGGELGDAERESYEQVQRAEAPGLQERLRPGDLVILHDPQVAGLVDTALEAGAGVLWRCHIGTDLDEPVVTRAWDFLKPYVDDVPRVVLSRADYAPSWLDADKTSVIPPSIDPASPKNMDLSDDVVDAILVATGIFKLDTSTKPEVGLPDGSTITVQGQATLVREDGPLLSDTIPVVQVSRWDRLKDMAGVLESFVEYVAGEPGCEKAHLLLVGPDVAGVTDDPEGQEVLQEVTDMWHALPVEHRRQVTLVSLPMDDGDENALMVNAIQRRARIVVQKSLMEGFGLTVAEAMWKGKPVVASRIGGIQDQIDDGETGVLVDARDQESFGKAVSRLVEDRDEAKRLGQAARERVLSEFLPDRHFRQWLDVLSSVIPE